MCIYIYMYVLLLSLLLCTHMCIYIKVLIQYIDIFTVQVINPIDHR